jgi:hypothetical protein
MSDEPQRLRPLDRVLVRETIAQVIWQERVMLERIHEQRWVWATMYGDAVIADLATIRELRVFRRPPRVLPQDLPWGLTVAQCDPEENFAASV